MQQAAFYIGAILTILLAALALGKAIAPLTKTEKDDKIFQAIHERVLILENLLNPRDVPKKEDTGSSSQEEE